MDRKTAIELLLNQNLRQYTHQKDVSMHIKATLDSFNQLWLKMENFTSNDGESSRMFCIDGTIPVFFRNRNYNIPIAIYLRNQYPYVEPIVYVRPTATMQIAPSEDVNEAGLVTVRDWTPGKSDLIGLLEVLQVTFGNQPPVFQKTPSSQPLTNIPTPATASYSGVGFPQPSALSTNAFLPPTPFGMGWSMPQPPTMMPRPQLPNYSLFPNQSQTATDTATTTTGSIQLLGGTDCSSFRPNPVDAHGQNSLPEDVQLRSVRSAVSDRLRPRHLEILEQLRVETQSLQDTLSKLNQGKELVNQMIHRMEQQNIEASKALERIKGQNAKLKDLLNDLTASENQSIQVDEVIDTTFPLYKQLVSSFTEEQAIAEAIYYLGLAFGAKSINLESFIENVRTLSRTQFRLQATVQKCREKAGLIND